MIINITPILYYFSHQYNYSCTPRLSSSPLMDFLGQMEHFRSLRSYWVVCVRPLYKSYYQNCNMQNTNFGPVKLTPKSNTFKTSRKPSIKSPLLRRRLTLIRFTDSSYHRWMESRNHKKKPINGFSYTALMGWSHPLHRLPGRKYQFVHREPFLINTQNLQCAHFILLSWSAKLWLGGLS